MVLNGQRPSNEIMFGFYYSVIEDCLVIGNDPRCDTISRDDLVFSLPNNATKCIPMGRKSSGIPDSPPSNVDNACVQYIVRHSQVKIKQHDK